MKKWNTTGDGTPDRFPDEVLQEYADLLAKDTNGTLTGKVDEAIVYDLEHRPKLITSLLIYIERLKQSYRFIEVEQLKEDAYPVNVKIIFFTGSKGMNEVKSSQALDKLLEEWIQEKAVGHLINHFMRLAELKQD